MKKINIYLLTIFAMTISFSLKIESIASSKYYHNKRTLSKNINFKPNIKFGGIHAQGKYTRKSQTATITHNDTNYSFKNIKRTLNPVKPRKKKFAQLTAIGSYSIYKSGPEMPVTYYLFGTQIRKPSNNKMTQKITLQTLQQLQKDQSQMGQNPTTYAPIRFQPAQQFHGDNLIGNYFNSTNVVTIHDPSGKNSQSYTFKNVQQGGIITPEGLVLIGSYTSSPHCNGNICSHAFMNINLYGEQINDEQSL